MSKTIYQVLLAISIMLTIFFATLNFNPTYPTEHQLNLSNEDIGINNLYILDTGHYTYIPDTFYFTNHSDQPITNITLTIKAKDKDIYTVSSGVFLDSDEPFYPNISTIQDKTLAGVKQLTCEIQYNFENQDEPKIFSEVIELNHIKK